MNIPQAHTRDSHALRSAKRGGNSLMVIAFAATGLLILKLRSLRAPTASVGQSICIRGQAAPDFALESVDGRTVHLSDFTAKLFLCTSGPLRGCPAGSKCSGSSKCTSRLGAFYLVFVLVCFVFPPVSVAYAAIGSKRIGRVSLLHQVLV